MGFLDRLDKIWDAGFEVGRTSVNTVIDIAEAPFTDDEYEGFKQTALGITGRRGAELLQATIGPEGVGGSLIGTLPGPVRRGGGNIIEGLETAYREAVAEPITTVMTMASLAQSRGRGGFSDDDMGVWFEPDSWRLAYKIAQDRSPGQAVVLAFLTDDILDQDQVIGAEQNRWFNLASGTWDAAMRIFLSPEVLAGGAFSGARAGLKRAAFNNYFDSGGGFRRFADDLDGVAEELAKPVREADNLVQSLADRRDVLKGEVKGGGGKAVKDELETVRSSLKKARRAGKRTEKASADILAGRIRDKYFAHHHEGDLISYELARALRGEGGFAGGRDSVENVMRFFMGEGSAVDRIAVESPAAAHRYKMLRDAANTVEDAVPPGVPGSGAKMFDGVQDVPDGMIAEIGEPHAAAAFASIENAVRPSVRRNIADKVNHSEFYRSNWAFSPVRAMRDMRPQHFVWAGDANSGEQVSRMLREAGYSPDEILKFRGQWARTDRYTRAETLAPRVQAEAIKKLIYKHFPDADADLVKQLRNDFAESHLAARRVLSNVRRYDAEKNISTVAWESEEGLQLLQVPLTPSQLRQTVSMVDVKRLDKFLAQKASKMPDAFFRADEIRGQFLDGVMKVWRPAVLLRPAWAIRVVGDEQLRMMAKIGTTERMKELLLENRPQYVEKVLAKAVAKTGVFDPAAAKKIVARRAATTGGLGLLVGGPIGGAVGVGGSLVRNTRAIKRLKHNLTVRGEARRMAKADLDAFPKQHLASIGEGPLDVLGYEVQAAFGDALAPQLVWQKANSANRQSGYLLLNEERSMWDDTVEALGEWREFDVADVFDPASEARFSSWWERVVNDQYGNNNVGRIAFDDTLGDADNRVRSLLEWLDTPEGLTFKKQVPSRFRDESLTEQWAQGVVAAADRMLSEPGLRAKVAAGKRIRFSDVKKVAGDDGVDWRLYAGSVHGQEAHLLGENKIADRVRGTVERLFDRLGTVTTDTLSRNPYFRRVYEDDMVRRIAAFNVGGGEYQISEQALRGLENSARRKALNETRDLLYDLAERSEFSDAMRNIMPFFNAYQEVLTRWAGLAVENPAFVAKMSMALRSEINTGSFFETVEVDDDRYFQMRLPEFARGLLEAGVAGKAIDQQGMIRFRADSLNMVTQIAPGVGPLVQIPVSQIVIADPQLEDAFKLVLPYGPIRGKGLIEQSIQGFQPAWLRRVTSSLREDRSYESQAATIMLTRMAEMADGDREMLDFGDGALRARFIAEVKRDASNFMYLRAVASAFSPASVGFHSPYQPYIDYYRELKASDPRSADDKFMAYLVDEGVEGFFALAARFSKNNEGLPATVEAEEVRSKYWDLIRRHPEVGGLILGIEGGGAAKFSAAVYEKQLQEDTSPGSGVRRRERMSLEGILTDSRVREGWQEYGRVNDAIFNEMRSRGLPNLRVAAAKDLLAAKQQIVEKMGERFPLWYDEYRNPDLTKWIDRIGGIRAIVKDPRMSERDDIRALVEYLRVRDAFTGELANRKEAGGASTLEARANQDLKEAWQAIMDQLLENPTFSDVLWRWLEFDPLSSDTWPTVQRTQLRAAA